jgi:thiol-disulfide isomerase/thioredoxin
VYAGRNMLPLYLKNGFNIKFDFDPSDFENPIIAYSGNGFETSSYLYEKNKIVSDFSSKMREISALEEAEFITKVNEKSDAQLSLLNNTQGLEEDYKALEVNDIKYSKILDMTRYESWHRYLTKNMEFKVSENFLSILDEVSYENESDFKFSNSYSSLVTSYYQSKVRDIQNDKPKYVNYIDVVSTNKSELIRNYLLYDYIKGSLKYTDDMKGFYEMYISTSTNQENKDEITKLYEKLGTVAAGQVSPTFENYENHAGGTTSLEDLKGKYIYIDVWATWCGPCKAEIPYLKEVEAKYHDKNIHFLSLSIDEAKDREKWVNMVNEKELGGIQLLADNAWNSQFVRDYMINGIPHFILLDPELKIVKYSAPRPSNPELIELFNELGI